MGLFDGILGGMIGAGMTQVVTHLIEEHGGVQGIVSELQSKGLGDTVQSWIKTGANDPVSAQALQNALGPDMMAQLAGKLGVSPDVMAAKLAEALPQAMDKLTPDGVIPKA